MQPKELIEVIENLKKNEQKLQEDVSNWKTKHDQIARTKNLYQQHEMQGVTKGNENIQALNAIREENEELRAKLSESRVLELENEVTSLKKAQSDNMLIQYELRA